MVQALLDGGCRIIGKTSLHELAFGTTGINAWTGTPDNPLYPGRIPGGSSSGSATAVAAGLCDFSLGTDTGGSVRIPAACCGVFGLKPSFGRVSRRGVMPEQSTLDCVGPFARDMDMLIEAMGLIAPVSARCLPWKACASAWCRCRRWTRCSSPSTPHWHALISPAQRAAARHARRL